VLLSAGGRACVVELRRCYEEFRGAEPLAPAPKAAAPVGNPFDKNTGGQGPRRWRTRNSSIKVAGYN